MSEDEDYSGFLRALGGMMAPAERQPSDGWRTPGEMACALDPAQRNPRWLQMVDDALMDVEEGRIKKLMILAPPQSGKSQRVSRWFPAHYLRRFPDRRIILASYGAEWAETWGRAVRTVFEQHSDVIGMRLSQSAKSQQHWELADHRGSMSTAGVGGTITGRSAELFIIDDPTKNQAEADSTVDRESKWQWWLTTAQTRVQEGGAVVLIMTRWHEDDLGGRFLANEPNEWTVLSFPALCEDEDTDPLGRKVGEPLWPERFSKETLEQRKETAGPRVWSALYQQRPTTEGGGIFKAKDFRYWNRVDEPNAGELWRVNDEYVTPSDCWRFGTADTATSKKTSADWTVVAGWAVTPKGDLLLLDIERQRLEEDDLPGFLSRFVFRNHLPWIGVEATFATSQLFASLTRQGIRLRALVADADKVTRAIPARNRMEEHRLFFPAGHRLLYELEQELLVFPYGAHDDAVDSVAYAAKHLDVWHEKARKSRTGAHVAPQTAGDLREAILRKRKKSKQKVVGS